MPVRGKRKEILNFVHSSHPRKDKDIYVLMLPASMSLGVAVLANLADILRLSHHWISNENKTIPAVMTTRGGNKRWQKDMIKFSG